MMNSKLVMGLVLGGGSVVTGALVWAGKKLSDLTRKVGMALHDLSEAEIKDIQEAIIERSVQQAANRKVEKFARDAECKAVNEMKSEIRSRAKEAVGKASADVMSAVEREIADQVAAIDHQALKKEVTKEAKQKVLEKFDGSLDDILQDFSDDLNRVKKIHTSIADALSEKSSGEKKGLTFTVGG